MRTNKMKIAFVDRIPVNINEGILYICLDCNVIVHLCACGCKEKVVLQIHPDFWKMIYDGEKISLWPSIGNFQYQCGSHYYIKNNKVIWCDTENNKISKSRKRKNYKMHQILKNIKKKYFKK